MPLLELRDVRKVFRSPDGEDQLILDVPAFQVEEGQQVAIAGTSGSGKTTFLNIIAGLLTPTAGEVRFDGEVVSGLGEARRDAWRAAELGYVFQTFNLLGGYTALENVTLGMMFGPGPDRDFARSLLVRLGLEQRMGHRPSQLSIGQQQRVALARALANRPRLVRADEPTGNLDRRFALEALGLLRDLCREQGAALVCVSHDPRVLDDFGDAVEFSTLNQAMAQELPGS